MISLDCICLPRPVQNMKSLLKQLFIFSFVSGPSISFYHARDLL